MLLSVTRPFSSMSAITADQASVIAPSVSFNPWRAVVGVLGGRDEHCFGLFGTSRPVLYPSID